MYVTTTEPEVARPALLRIRDVAAELNVGTGKVRELLRDGELPHVRIGKQLRVPTTALDEYLAERTSHVLRRI